MNRLDQLLEKCETVIVEGVEFKIFPFSAQDFVEMGITDFNQMDTPDIQTMNKMIKLIVKWTFPEATEAQLSRFPLTYFEQFKEAIMKANKMALSVSEQSAIDRANGTQ